MAIAEVVRRVLGEEHGDVIRASVRAVAQEIMEAEVSELIGGVRVREDVTGKASIHSYGMTLDHAIRELRAAAKALQVEQPRG